MLAFGSGLPLGVLGSGASIVTLPVLVYVAVVPMASAVEMSMALEYFWEERTHLKSHLYNLPDDIYNSQYKEKVKDLWLSKP